MTSPGPPTTLATHK
jgi:hypothetical protein